eukprot:Selendium_serpulae@DN5655_c0_g1_i1.p2
MALVTLLAGAHSSCSLISIFSNDSNAGKLNGYRPTFSTTTGSASESATMTLDWSIDFKPTGEKVIGMASVVHGEFGNTPTVVRANVSLLYKYVNKNLIAVVTEASMGMNLYLINAIGGSVVFLTVLPDGAALPLHLMLHDNFALVHYWNYLAVHYELHTVELFDAETDKGVFDLVFSKSRDHNLTISSHDLKPPAAFSQTYISPGGIRAWGATVSNEGITPRSLILALSTNKILAIPGKFVTGRRTVPKGKDTTDGPPYAALLPSAPKEILSSVFEVWHTRGIASFPTHKESTCILFTFGLDLFSRPMAPAQEYDSLNPTLGWVANTIVLVVGVYFVVIVTTKMASNKQVKSRWQ